MHLNKYLLKKKATDPAMADVPDVGYAPLLFILLKLLSISLILFLSQNLSCSTEAKFVRPESLFFFVRLHHEIRALLSSKVDSYDAARIS